MTHVNILQLTNSIVDALLEIIKVPHYEDAEDDADEIPMDESLALVPLTGGVTCA